MNNYIKSPINYIGNKYRLLKQIIPFFPQHIDTFADICCGSSTVAMNVSANKYILNDINYKVLAIIKQFVEQSPNYNIKQIKTYIEQFDLSKTNEEGFKQFRDIFNNELKDNPIALYTLMSYSFNYQYRFNNDGIYNGSFGRNRSQFSKNQECAIQNMYDWFKDKEVLFSSLDISDLKSKVEMFDNSFVYIDPPYLDSTASYSDGKRLFGDWTETNEYDMYELLIALNDRNIKFAVSNNLTMNSEIGKFAKENGFMTHHLYANYSNCNYQKKDKVSKDNEVLITNY